MKYNVRGCRETIKHDVHRTVISIETVGYEEAQYFGVYEPAGGGAEIWLADFHYLDDAQMFALGKEKEAANSETVKEKIESILEKVNDGLGEWQSVSIPYCPASAVPLKEAQAELVDLLEDL